MEKYAIQDDDLIANLRGEEHELMLKISNYMSLQEKTAQEESEFRSVQTRLQRVRDKITEHDLRGFKGQE